MDLSRLELELINEALKYYKEKCSSLQRHSSIYAIDTLQARINGYLDYTKYNKFKIESYAPNPELVEHSMK